MTHGEVSVGSKLEAGAGDEAGEDVERLLGRRGAAPADVVDGVIETGASSTVAMPLATSAAWMASRSRPGGPLTRMGSPRSAAADQYATGERSGREPVSRSKGPKGEASRTTARSSPVTSAKRRASASAANLVMG